MAVDELALRRDVLKRNAAASFISRTIRSIYARLAGQHFNGDRDLYDVCGYPRHIGPEEYLGAYLRGDLAARVVDAYPDATWREPPTVKRDGTNEGDDDDFSKAIEELDEKFGFWSVLSRLDRLAGLGHYGVLLVGLDGGVPLDQPVEGGGFRLLYLNPFGEVHAQILEWEKNERSPRYGKPLRYRLTIGPDWQGVGGANRSVDVHWTRVIHIAERALDDEAIGLPRLERIYNRVMDCEKLLGGSAEIYWQNAAQLRAWKADPEVEWDPDEQKAMEEQFEELYHGLRRDLRLRGVEPHQLAAAVADPKGHLDAQLDFISGATGIPKRILIGSERGELASEQDENNWTARVMERRTAYATPHIIRPTIDRLIRFGVLPNPGRYVVEWPESDSLGEKARSEIAKAKAEAVSAYVSIPGAELVVPPQEFRRWLGESEISEFEPPEESLLDETDPDVADQFSGAAGETGPRELDGAQFQAIAGIVESVATGSMPPQTALELIRVGFPIIPEASARRIVEPLVGFVAATPAATPAQVAMTVNRAIRRELGDLVKNAAARPLYVRRQVLNAEELIAWAKAQGFATTVPAEEMHVTITFSREPVDWLRMGEAYEEALRVPPGGPRVVEGLGPDGAAIALLFNSSALAWRHEEMRRAGASWDWPDYQPHVTLTYQGAGLELEDVEPYRGEILLGPEIFEEISDDWSESIEET